MSDVFPIAPYSGSGSTVLLAVLVVSLIVILGLLGYTLTHLGKVRFEVDQAFVRISGDLYGRTIAMEKLDVDGARVIDLDATPLYRFKWRTNGIGLPGYSSGWFRLRNGEKALVFVTDKHRVLYVPTTEGYALMMSPADPERLLQTLQAKRR